MYNRHGRRVYRWAPTVRPSESKTGVRVTNEFRPVPSEVRASVRVEVDYAIGGTVLGEGSYGKVLSAHLREKILPFRKISCTNRKISSRSVRNYFDRSKIRRFRGVMIKTSRGTRRRELGTAKPS